MKHKSTLGFITSNNVLSVSIYVSFTSLLYPLLAQAPLVPLSSSFKDLTPNDIDLPIAFHQGKRSITSPPVPNFIFLGSFNLKYYAFITSLSSVSILKYYH